MTSPIADHIVIIGVDGMGGYFINKKMAELDKLCPTFNALLKGTHTDFDTVFSTTKAKTIVPPISAPAWASVLSGLAPDQTGIDSNQWPMTDVDEETGECLQTMPEVTSPNCATIPQTIFDLIPLKSMKSDSAKSCNDGVIKHLSIVAYGWLGTQLTCKIPSIVDTIRYTYDDLRQPDGSLRSADEDVVTEYLKVFRDAKSEDLPRLTFLHFDDVDTAGHKFGWGSEAYYSSWLKNDEKLNRILAPLKDKSVAILILADHGGSEKQHGNVKASHMFIPMTLVKSASCPPIQASAFAKAESNALRYNTKNLTDEGSECENVGVDSTKIASLARPLISVTDVVPTLLALQGIAPQREVMRGKVLATYVE